MRHDDRLCILSRRRQRREMDAILEPIGVLDRPHERGDSIDPLLLGPPRTSPRRYQPESKEPLSTSTDTPVKLVLPDFARPGHPFSRHPKVLLRLGVLIRLLW